MTRPEPVSVRELNAYIKSLIDSDGYLGSVAVRGELSNYKVYPSGHHYFTLKDAESSVRCVMFRSAASKLRFRPESGMGVIVYGRVSVYPRDGAYQLYCEAILPEGSGALQLAYEQLREKLAKEGLFDREHKKPIPRYPERIAVVTSSAGAAVHDIIRVLRRRWPLAKVILLPVRVQGEEAPPEIAAAIRWASEHRIADTLITGRGGGSIEDLWAFNDERVARAIYDCEIPVISAVGHEPDVTIADFVADLRAATPSNAAELAAPDVNELLQAIDSARSRLDRAVLKKVGAGRESLDALASRRVLVSATGFIEQRRLRLDALKTRLEGTLGFVERLKSRLEAASARLNGAADASLAARKNEYVRLAAKLDALSPLKVLSRGYAIALDAEGRAVKDARGVAVGERLTVKLNSGALGCRVEESYGEQ
ncbi:MAG TPA: exodeoxyribonuclease VII large subunit [Candidatus Scatomorpha merdipullorum]|uniref:Exodeoxyribonuclease 7 large subunit n=1 Tax=Candidatus Scatomorpha merdipullorum TaxID=2840927 RepID=A0A9D1FC79_9FIRM|nr:exodeoxyribonuclease VII large subunit [Candidatus Scatomorpha merdipullorum]